MRTREYSSLSEHLPDLICRYDRELRYLYVNQAFERFMGGPKITTWARRTKRRL